jgi:hypothetical protein
MKKSELVIGVVAGAALGVCVGWGIAISQSKRLVDHYVISSRSAEINRSTAIGMYLRASAIENAQFLVEMSIDNSLLTLDAYRDLGVLDQSAIDAMHRGIEYRSNVPFVDELDGVKRGGAVAIEIDRITRSEQ